MQEPSSPIHLEMRLEIPGVEPKTESYTFQKPMITIGRDETSDVQIPLSTASRNHAILKHEDGQWYVEDLKSTHGTEHNGQHVGKGGVRLFRPGDTLKIIHLSLEYVSGPQPELNIDQDDNPTQAARNMVGDLMATIGAHQDLPYLRVMNGPAEGQKFEIRPDLTEALVGRADECDFQINDANVSRQHAKILRDWNDITIHDAGSKNGVVLNNKKLGKPKRLRDADEILLGAVRLTFVDPTAAILQTLEGLPAFARDEESIDEESALGDIEDPQQGKDLDPMMGGGENLDDNSKDDDDLDENSVASALSSMSTSMSGSSEMSLSADLSGFTNKIVTGDELGEVSGIAPSPQKSAGLSGVEKVLIGVSAVVFLGLLAGVLIFLVVD